MKRLSTLSKYQLQASLIGGILSVLVGCDFLKKAQPLPEVLAGQVTDHSGAPANEKDLLKNDYLLLYFSAHWCPPCRAFTPKLIQFYQQYGGGKQFNLLFISSDRSEEEMQNYIKETRMPWHALTYRGTAAQTLIDQFSGAGIPRLVLITPSGEILADSYKGKRYIGPQTVIEELKTRLSTNQPHPTQATQSTHPNPNPIKEIPIDTRAPLSETLQQKYTLNGLGQSRSGNMAIINGQARETGDELEPGVIIFEIYTDAVELLSEGRRYRLYPES